MAGFQKVYGQLEVVDVFSLGSKLGFESCICKSVGVSKILNMGKNRVSYPDMKKFGVYRNSKTRIAVLIFSLNDI